METLCFKGSILGRSCPVPPVTFVPRQYDHLVIDSMISEIWGTCDPAPLAGIGGRAVPRCEVWFGPRDYRFGGRVIRAREMGPELSCLLRVVNRDVNQPQDAKFDSIMANLYRDGQDSVCMHDDGPWMAPRIASVTLADHDGGRVLRYRQKKPAGRSEKSYDIPTGHGDLLVDEGSAGDWRHGVPKARKVRGRRLSLTFRRMSPHRSITTPSLTRQEMLF